MGEILQLVGPPTDWDDYTMPWLYRQITCALFLKSTQPISMAKGLTDLMLFSQVGRILHYFATFVESLGEN